MEPPGKIAFFTMHLSQVAMLKSHIGICTEHLLTEMGMVSKIEGMLQNSSLGIQTE